METPKMDKSKQEICTITIMFPVDTDEQAIGFKKQITDILSDKPDARLEFRLSELSPYPPMKQR